MRSLLLCSTACKEFTNRRENGHENVRNVPVDVDATAKIQVAIEIYSIITS